MSRNANARDLTGEVFGELTVEGLGEQHRDGRWMWACSCSCGGTHQAKARLLLDRKVKRCPDCTARDRATRRAVRTTTVVGSVEVSWAQRPRLVTGLCSECERPPVDPVWPWAGKGEVCRACFVALDDREWAEEREMDSTRWALGGLPPASTLPPLEQEQDRRCA